ncbi:PREDICTED: uncharacterized protein LOC104608611 [Nelumbo nucifera]|uniref:Uncharacterized protein n=2 Tax=Nelumbo nucifera TaxID=4432 RepID=A0A822XKG5_NELNU|nr:PREDICTED: uncharacterized protein LOC104608611 [Nelumbo nucifera]DAD22064.1 TPA_asm: hypothetical protein HUJ06_023527 [Nelumbo nucifera]
MGTWWKRRCCSSSIYASPSTAPSVALIPLSILLPPKAITKLIRCCSRMVPASILGTTAVRMSNASDSPVRQTREQLHHNDKPSPVKQLRDHIIHHDNSGASEEELILYRDHGNNIFYS